MLYVIYRIAAILPVSYTHLPSDGTVRVAGHVHRNAVRAMDAASVQLLREQPRQYGGPDRAYAGKAHCC